MNIAIDTSATKLFGAGTTTYIHGLLSGFSEIETKLEITEVGYRPFFSRDNRILRSIDTILREIIWIQGILPASIKRNKFDVFHAPAAIGPINCPAPLVVTVYDIYILKNPSAFPAWQSRMTHFVLPRLLRKAATVITISEFTKSELLSCYPDIDPHRVMVTLCGVDRIFQPATPNKIQNFFNRFRIEKPYLLSVCTLEPRKNLHRLLTAFASVKDQINHDLILVGAYGWKSSGLNRAIADFGLSDRVRLLGYLSKEDLPAAYSGADAFAYVSLYEGFGLPPLEAMACGCPVITSNVTSLPEVVGNAVITIDPTSITEIAEGIVKILTITSLREQLRKHGPLQAAQFTWRKCAEATLLAYQKAVS